MKLDKEQAGQLRQAEVSTWDIQKLAQISKRGGEVDMWPERYPPDEIRRIDRMVARGLVVIVDPASRGRITLPLEGNVGRITARCGSRIALAMTDKGREIQASLDMTIMPASTASMP